MARRKKAAVSAAPRPRKKAKWPWIIGGLIVLGAAMGGGGEGTNTSSQTEIAQEAPAQQSAPQTLVSEVPAEEADANPVEAEPAAPDAASILALGSAPETVTSLDYSVEGDRQYYSWDRPDLGREVNTVYLAPDDWWVKISDPTFHASELGELESVTDQVGRYTSGPLTGALVVQNSVIHLWSQKYYDRENAPEPEPVVAEELAAEPEAGEVAEPESVEEVPQVYEEAAETVQPLFFANCSDAKAQGYSNMTPDHPGYAPKLDRDGDGLACES